MRATAVSEIDPAVRNLWHPVAAMEELRPGCTMRTQLFDQSVAVTLGDHGDVSARLDAEDGSAPSGGVAADGMPASLPTKVAYEFAWTSLGTAPEEIFSIPECDEPDRRNLSAGTIGVRVSAPRAVENFLDMGHFPYVHAGILGQAPRTEVLEYAVDVDPATNDLFARDCEFYQPYAAAAASGGQRSQYTYRVPHPYCVMLYKSCPIDGSRLDVIALFVQSLSPDRVRAHNFMSLIDDQSTDSELRRFQQHIFGQDKPILENQNPRLLPLDPTEESSVRADRSSMTYRRWLSELGVTYGVIPERRSDDDF